MDTSKTTNSAETNCAATLYSSGGQFAPLPLKDAVRNHTPPTWLGQLIQIAGDQHVYYEVPDLWAYSRDRSPFSTFQIRNGNLPATLPSAVVCPASVQELMDIVTFTRGHNIPVIPFGAGSGVLGGTLPLAHELIIDLKRLNRIIGLNEVDGVVTVQAGMNGAQFEAALNAKGFTCGHLPQSLHMSTVGGWAACRGAGQNSSRYGKIEDMILGLEVILPDSRPLRIRPVARRAVGPSLKDLFIGSEGVLGILTELSLRVWRLPEVRHGVVLAFPSEQAGLDALRTVMQSELRPAIVRLYDQAESSHRTCGISEFVSHPVLAILEFSGTSTLAAIERDLSIEICSAFGARLTDNALYNEWLANRFTSMSAPWQARDYFMDTIEITGSWSALPEMYKAMCAAVQSLSPEIEFGAHWSHVYSEGACQYMTIRISPMSEEKALHLMRQAWCAVHEICLEKGGSISHHHGVGLFRNEWLPAELTAGLGILRALKRHLDPDNLFVPGKLGFNVNAGADGTGTGAHT